MLNRRTLLGTGAAALGAAMINPGRAQAAEYTLKWGHSMQLNHSLTIRGTEAVERIREETDGRVDIQIFPNSQLGGDSDMASQVRSGALEMYTPAATSFAPLIPVVGIVNTAFAFKDSAAGWAAMDGELGGYIRQQFEPMGVHVFDNFWENGFRQITTSEKPIMAPEDLSGMKMRVPISPMLQSMFQALDASPTSMNVSELYSALQTKVVDGQENPLSVISSRNFNEVQNYCSLTNHSWDTWFQVVNLRVWERIPEELQEIIARNINASGLQQRQDIQDAEASLKAQLQEAGMEFVDPDRDAFREALKTAGFYSHWREVFGEEAWGKLEASVGGLG